jgi:sugar/nucleoside kinase (ribokinase family)
VTQLWPPLDLLVVGGLTIDRFPDGTSLPGGPVTHIARAAAPRGMRVGVVTAAGRGPKARAGVEELRQLAVTVECAEVDATPIFIHRESPGGRRLWLERTGGRVRLAGPQSRVEARAVLLAPVAGEIVPEDFALLDRSRTRGALLQGWLRTVGEDGEVHSLPLAAVEPGMLQSLMQFDLLVASREDLLGEASGPLDQLHALRLRVGDTPTLVVTDGPRGLWIGLADVSGTAIPVHLPVPRLVEGVPTVGAGDILAAFMLAGDWPRPTGSGFVRQRAELAMRVVAEVLEERRG